MSEQELDGSDVRAAFQEMGGEAVPQGVDGDVLAQPARRGQPGRTPATPTLRSRAGPESGRGRASVSA